LRDRRRQRELLPARAVSYVVALFNTNLARGALACIVEILSASRDARLLVFTLRALRGLVPDGDMAWPSATALIKIMRLHPLWIDDDAAHVVLAAAVYEKLLLLSGNGGGRVFASGRAARAIASGADGSGRTKPVLIEAMTYRESHHSTSDDSTRYRDPKEIESWRASANPVRRLRAFLERRGWWDAEKEAAAAAEARREVLQALQAAEKKDRPAVDTLFEDVYGDKELPQSLARQKLQLDEHLLEHADHYAAKKH
jgi:hypothetical protein